MFIVMFLRHRKWSVILQFSKFILKILSFQGFLEVKDETVFQLAAYVLQVCLIFSNLNNYELV